MYQAASRSGSPSYTATYASSTSAPPTEQRTSFLYGETVRRDDIVIKDHKRTIEICVVPVVVFVATLLVIAIIAHSLVKADLHNSHRDHHTGPTLSNETSETGAKTNANDECADESDRCEMARRRRLVVTMAREAWTAYRTHAWPSDALRPVTSEPYADVFGARSGLTIVAAMSTLWVMGLRAEFDQGRTWIRDELNFGAIKREVDVQHSVNYYLGGLLSCYALTADPLFLNKSIEIADLLAPVYKSPSGLPYWKISPSTGHVSHKTPFVSVLAGQHLEYRYLADLTGNATYADRVNRIRRWLSSVAKPHGLYMHQVDVQSGEWHTNTATLFAPGRLLYSYLVKAYVQSGQRDGEALRLYRDALDAVARNHLIKQSSTGQWYARQYNLNAKYYRYERFMNYDACALGAMFAIGVHATATTTTTDTAANATDREWRWALDLTDTCVRAANATVTGLSPYRFYFDYRDEELEVDMARNGRTVLGPELAETYFTLWRLTGDRRYREFAWAMATAIHTHCRTDDGGGGGGYSQLDDVNHTPTKKTNLQTHDFVGATLKYLYLTFAEDSELSLDQWVMNARAQPLPVFGRHHSYSATLMVDETT